MSVELHLGDCLEVMRSMPDKSVDAIITSPPYNLQNAKKGSFYAGNKGDTISYDSYEDNLPQEDYIAWQREFIKLCYQKIKPTGVIYYNHKPRSDNGVWDDRRNLIPLPIRQEIIWDRQCMVNFNGRFFAPNTERIFIIAKEGWKPQKDTVGWGEIWRVPPDIGVKHPAPFPLRLAKRMVVSATEVGGTVLDPFMGSGTTGVACVQTGRNFIGIEIDPEYFAIAEKRIKEAQMQMRLL